MTLGLAIGYAIGLPMSVKRAADIGRTSVPVAPIEAPTEEQPQLLLSHNSPAVMRAWSA